MEMRGLGRLGPQISVIGHGAWEAGGADWGPNPSDEDVISAMRAGIDAGMNWIDTAEVYGDGRSEELVGRAVRGRRDDVLIFTKVAPDEEGSGIRPEQVHSAIRRSLKRLGVDHIDLYQVHWPDDRIPVEETWGAMDEVEREGLTRHVGVSNFDRPLIERCLPIRHVDSVQNECSLLHRDDVAGLLPWLAEQGIGYLAYGPLGFGLLTGAIGPDTPLDEHDWRRLQREGSSEEPGLFSPGAFESNLETVERLRKVAAERGIELASLALRWVLDRAGATAAIAGSRNAAHVRSNAAAGGLPLGADALAELDAIVG